MTTLPFSRTMALSQTIAAPARKLDAEVTKEAFVPTSRRFGGTSVLPRISVEGGRVTVEPATGERYLVLKSLGEGAMGEVALVEDRDIGRKVARKRLLPGSGAADVLRFVDEVRMVGKLDHPGIVPIHDVGLDEHGEFFFVMKYVEGESLESVVERIRDRDPATLAAWDPARRVHAIIAILRALDYAHASGLLHRDIKPANVMVGRYGEVMLMDWGVSRPIGGARDEAVELAPGSRTTAEQRVASTGTGAIVGTPIFMSPEQAAGATDTLTPSSDLYAVCLMLHELLTGQHLHDGIDDLHALLTRVMTMPAPSVGELVTSGLSKELGYFMQKGLALAPKDRWQSAGAMADELLAILDGRCRVQCPFTLTKRTVAGFGRFFDRRPFVALSILLGFAGTFLALAAIVVLR